MNKIFKNLILCCLLCGSLYSVETPKDTKRPILSQYPGNQLYTPEELSSNLRAKSFILFGGSFFGHMMPIIPSATLSIRSQYVAYDFSIQSLIIYNNFSCTVSPTLYLNSSERRPYISVGIGPTVTVFSLFGSSNVYYPGVIAPVRIGYESDNVIWDVGALAIYCRDFNVRPEFRLGVKF